MSKESAALADDDKGAVPDATDDIIIEDEIPEAPEGGSEDEKPKTGDEGIQALKDQLVQIAKEKEDAEARALQANQEKSQALQVADQQAQRSRKFETDLDAARFDTITSAIDSAKSDEDSATQKFIAAHEAGDAPKMAAAQLEMADARARLVNLNAGKEEFEARQKEPKEEPRQPTQPQNPVEDMIRASNLAPRQADWLRKHPEAVTDPRKNATMLKSHWDAIDAGHREGSEDYFNFLDEGMGYKQPQKKDVVVPPKTPSAPPSREIPNSEGKSPTKITLNKNEKEIALQMNPDLPEMQALQEYAKHKKEALRRGLYPHQQG